MDAKKIIFGYMTQLTKGCDNVRCLNEYCRSSKNFRFKFSKDNEKEEARAEALKLLKNHSKEDHLCNGILFLNLNVDELEKKAKDFNSIISPVDFTGVKIEFDKEKTVSYMKDFDLLPYLFSPGGQFTDDQLDKFFEYVFKNNKTEPFSSIESVLPTFVKKLIEPSKIMNTRYHFNHCIIMLIYLSIFPIDEFSKLFSDLVLHIDTSIVATEVYDFFRTQFSLVTQSVKRILSFAQDNLTYATIDEKDPQDPIIIAIARLFEILRQSNLNLPSSIFSNELFTTQSLNFQTEVEKTVKKAEAFKYLDTPAVLTLPFKFDCLNLYYQINQFTFTQREFIEILLNPNSLNQRFFTILVKRSNLYENTMQILSQAKPDQLSRHLKVVFEGEEGVDAGGVSREFFYLNCNEIFSDKYGMFFRLKNGKYWFQWSTVAVEPIFFKTLGILVFLAVYNSIILPIRFPQLLYKKLSHKPLTLDDYEEIDEELVKSLKYLRVMKENGEDISKLETTFSITRDNFGAILEIPLCEGGENKTVTNDNVEEYIDLYADWLMNKSIESQFRSFENGFNIITVRPEKNDNVKLIYKIFNFDELDILVSGEEIINWEQLKVNSQYIDGYTENSQEIKWFWEIFDEMTEAQKKNFFRFSTGSDRAPVGGLDLFHLKIQKTFDSTKLPVAHTCMNIFSLPNYSTKEDMKQKVLIAIENTEGFGLI